MIGGANFDELMRKIEEFRASLDNSSEFRNFEAKFKEKLKYLEENLEKERDIVKSFAGEKSALACKLKDLENELENMKRENGDMRQRLSDEKCVPLGQILGNTIWKWQNISDRTKDVHK